MDRYVMQSHYLIEFCPSFNYDLVSDNTPWQFTWDIRLISPILRFLKYIYIYMEVSLLYLNIIDMQSVLIAVYVL